MSNVRFVSTRKVALLGSAAAMAIGLSGAPAFGQNFFCGAGGIFDGGINPGVCSTPSGTAFSTAALSSQALSEVSQTVTQQSTETAFAAVQRRREQETTPAPRRAPTRGPRDAKSPDIMVYKAPAPPAYLGPTYAAWGHVFGDYETRDDNTSAINSADPNPISLDRRMTTWGVLGGVDATYRHGPSVWVVGLLAGYMSSDVRLNGRSNGTGGTNLSTISRVDARIDGPSIGAYASYAQGPWSADITLKVDFMEIDQSFTETITNFGITTIPSSGAVKVDMTNVTIGGNLNYRIPISPTHWWEPTGGFRYTHSDFGSNATVIGLTDGSVFRLQGGVRFGWEQYTGPATWRTTLTGLLYSDVSVDGLVISTNGFAGSPVLPSDEGKLRAMGILAMSYDNGAGVVWYGQGDVRGGEDLFGIGGRIGVRVRLN
jgi:outer membrane autotransporter protein